MHLKASRADGKGDGIGRVDQNKHWRLSYMSMHLELETLPTRVQQGTLVKNINRWYEKNGDRGLIVFFFQQDVGKLRIASVPGPIQSSVMAGPEVS